MYYKLYNLKYIFKLYNLKILLKFYNLEYIFKAGQNSVKNPRWKTD